MPNFISVDPPIGKRTATGRKLNQLYEGDDFYFDGGRADGLGGGGFCCIGANAIGFTRIDKTKKLDKFLAYINKMVIRSRFDVWAAATSTVCNETDIFGDPCPNYYVPNNDSDANIYIGVSPDGLITDAQIRAQTLALGGPWKAKDRLAANAYTIDITKVVPQPKDANYTGNLVVSFLWDSATYYTYSTDYEYLADFDIIQKDQEYAI